ncbi:MAG: type VI secretion system-associated FHA domain protein TagH [Thiolinea sp.]
MSLVLRIIRFEKGSPPSEMECQWNEMGGTIGRNSANDWVLPDAQRFLSGRHAAISAKAGDYYITDTSTNGVFINGKATPLGRDNSARLEHGDVLKMGVYEIEVVLQIREKDISPAVMPAGLFDEPEENLTPERVIPDDDPTGAVSPAGGFVFPEAEPDADELALDEPALLDDWDKIDPVESRAVEHIPDDPFFVDNEFSNGLNDREILPGSEDLRRNDQPLPVLDDFFAPPEIEPPKAESYDHQPQVLPAEFQKEKAGAGMPEIPDDFWAKSDNDLIDPFSMDNKVQDIRQEEREADISPQLAPDIPVSTPVQKTSSSFPDADEIRRPSTSVSAPVPDSGSKTEKPEVRNEELAVSRDQVMADFVRGLGISDAGKKRQIEQHLEPEKVGELFRILLQGCMDVMRTRTSIKSEMRMDVTTIQPVENNPVKFSVDADDALLKLLVSQGQSYMQPEIALAEAFDDIKAHQVAVIAGVQTSLKHVLKRFEPEKLVERLEKQSPVSANIPIHRQAKLWELFEGLYSTIETEADDDFHRLFGLEFSRAYEAQIAKLESMRGNS